MHRVACVLALSLFLVVPANAQRAAQAAGLMAVDIFGGFASHVGYGSAETANENEAERFNGWDLGASFRPHSWFGITGTIGRTWIADTRLMHYLAGPRFSTSFDPNYWGMRGFAHALVGVGSVSTPGLPSKSGLEMAVGAGADFVWVFRMQFDYLRLPDAPIGSDGTRLSQHQIRFVLAAVVPLCFRGCRPNDVDGIDLSK